MILIIIITTRDYHNFHNDSCNISITEIMTIIDNSSRSIVIIPLTIITSCIMILDLFSFIKYKYRYQYQYK